MSVYGKTRSALQQHHLAPKKKFGQNFLVHRHTAEAIVRAGEIGPDDVIVEVGVGLAALTLPLAQTARRVVGIEIDSGIIRFHQQEHDLPDNVILLHRDILKTDFDELEQQCGGRLKIIANLPYSISNPFIFKLIENRRHVEKATIMLQKEVADRLLAAPGSKDYGIPSVLLQHCARVRKMLTLSPAEFHPQPKIDSVVIQIAFHLQQDRSDVLSPEEMELFTKIVRAAFSQRRKTILNTLSSANFFPALPDRNDVKKLTEDVIITAGLSPQVRPETLPIKAFEDLSRSFHRFLTGTA
ncbi:ribosomal RNA small subunit methyltransferase A [Desulfoprunum benzoelyticum]|uniref:Ribosomal RNA small subunit methyltransferase A n=1 Tax=Desulfoprunum benzoelyticum TaxID=1506996 RepID=A0A840UPR1_9BACT|nr:16S rRNA (adenine(1518)-N(6)/adenine(1519)-N(6))-dimethyltransferase RsmA [Desulfoprunum benzoelyticum]MBB5346543.1 16S rRNA (adenine1518-N6/adenine1519-N6)-dimethyltransferase [Desulfoprunum benzoelyticum]MBM9528928.1 ribosomal RNA small subunit methyltransferase A [Desulfoprunum benzoelyticum]